MNSSMEVVNAMLHSADRIALWRDAIGWETYWEQPTQGSDLAKIIAVKYLPDGRRVEVTQSVSFMALRQSVSPGAALVATERKLLDKISEAENEI